MSRTLDVPGRKFAVSLLVMALVASAACRRGNTSAPLAAEANPATETPMQSAETSSFGVFHIEPGSQWWIPARMRWAMTETRDLGAGWVRLNLHWIMVEKSRGVYDWSKPDQWVQAAEDAGIEIMMGVAGYAPPGANAQPPYGPADPT